MWHTPREKDHYVQVGSRRRYERVYIPKLTAKIQSAQGVEKVDARPSISVMGILMEKFGDDAAYGCNSFLALLLSTE